MPLVAPLWGLLTPPWGLTFIKVAQLAGQQLELLYDEPLFPAPKGLTDLGWQARSVTTSEAGRWMRSLLTKRLGDIEYTTVHTLKSTPLSWCAKAGLDQNNGTLISLCFNTPKVKSCTSKQWEVNRILSLVESNKLRSTKLLKRLTFSSSESVRGAPLQSQ